MRGKMDRSQSGGGGGTACRGQLLAPGKLGTSRACVATVPLLPISKAVLAGLCGSLLWRAEARPSPVTELTGKDYPNKLYLYV